MIKKRWKAFIDWLEYYPKTDTADGWVTWERNFKKNAPIRYYLTHILPNKFSRIRWTLHDARIWLIHRTYDRYHVVKTGLKPGYYEIDIRLLHSSFSLLVDYVEIQAASEILWWGEKYKLPEYKKYDKIPFYYRLFFREPKLGIESLEWAASLDDPNSPHFDKQKYGIRRPQLDDGEFTQASVAREVLELYRWWTELRPNRTEVPYPEDIAEIPEHEPILYRISEEYREKYPDSYRKSKEWAEKSRLQDEEWDEEDTEMLMRLVKIRRMLWV